MVMDLLKSFRTLQRIATCCLACSCVMFSITAAATQEMALTLHGEPKYSQGFTHFDYVNPEAPKGGKITLAAFGTFDTLNPFIEKGTPPAGIFLLYDTLMAASRDEPFSRYPLIAEAVDKASDNSQITFYLNKNARFHDGHPITADDVLFTFNLLTEQGSPFYRSYYSDVAQVNIIDKQTIRFLFKHTNNRELPLILAELPVMPKHYWDQPDNTFLATSLEPPLGSGPYRISAASAGKHIHYERVKDYWAKDLPVNQGRHNFDQKQFNYYRDTHVMVEALKAGDYDLRFENVAKNWATAYDIPAVASGALIKEQITTLAPEGMQGFLFNTRKPLFANPLVRSALLYAMDFEWLNRQLFYDSYRRSTSYFANSDMMATGLPSVAEQALLAPFRDQLPPQLFTEPYQLPVTDGSGNIRPYLQKGLALLKQAGWTLNNGELLNEQQARFRLNCYWLTPPASAWRSR